MPQAGLFLVLFSIAALTRIEVAQANPTLTLIAQYDDSADGGGGFLSVQGATRQAAVANRKAGTVTILDLFDPANPQPAGRHELELAGNEEVTSVALHPADDYYVVTISIAGSIENGRIQLRDVSSGVVLNELEAGPDPGGAAIGPLGRFAVIPNQATQFAYDAATGQFHSPPGSLTILDLRGGPHAATARTVTLADATGVAGLATEADRATIRRNVDLDMSGWIDQPVDFDGDGNIGAQEVPVGAIDGRDVLASEDDGEDLHIPFVNNTPKYLAPDNMAFTRDGRHALVTLPENNAIAVIDVHEATLVGYHGLGIAAHHAATGGELPEQDINGRDEAPHGVVTGAAITADERYLITAGTEVAGSEAPPRLPGLLTVERRGIGVFDLATGELLGTAGKQLDEAVERAGMLSAEEDGEFRPEPGKLVTFVIEGANYAALGLGRADAVALVSLTDPAAPRVVAVASVKQHAGLGAHGPDGIAYFGDANIGHYLVAANAMSASISVFEITPIGRLPLHTREW